MIVKLPVVSLRVGYPNYFPFLRVVNSPHLQFRLSLGYGRRGIVVQETDTDNVVFLHHIQRDSV